MTRRKKTDEDTGDATEQLLPVSITEQELPKQEPNIGVPDGHVYIVALNPDGTEQENSGFFYPIKNHLKYYGDETKYVIKKKAQ